MNRITRWLCLSLVFALVFALPAFAKAPGDYKIVLILPGPINDQNWNASNYAGLQAANKALGTRIEYVENVQPSDHEALMRNYGERGYDLVMAAGTQYDEPALRIAPKYPNTTYCVINGAAPQAPNVTPVLPKEYEAAFLAGLIGGSMSKSGKFGVVGAFPNELMIRLLNNYEWGARHARPDAQFTRAFANTWSDLALGKQMSSSMIDSGVDMLFFYANQVGLGAIQAAKERGISFVGFAGNQNSVAPGTVVASVYFDFTDLYVWALKRFFEGELKPVVNEAGIKEGTIKVAFGDNVPEKTKAMVEEASKAIVDGRVLHFLSNTPVPVK